MAARTPHVRQTYAPLQWLAWAGWALRVPCGWRPLYIEGTARDGTMVVGSAEEAVARFHWRREGPAKGKARRLLPRLRGGEGGAPEFDAEERIERLARRAAPGASPSGGGPAPEGFDTTRWLPNLKDGGGIARCIWYGWSARTRMLFEAVVRDTVGGANQRLLAEAVLPTFAATEEAGRTRWAIFDISFESPAGFRMAAYRLQLGDMALHLKSDDGRRLIVRQVYPASLALMRRELPGWLDDEPFVDRHRALRRRGAATEACRIETPHGAYDGVRRAGWKRLAWPLGTWLAHRNTAIVLHDRELDRLLLAECDSPQDDARDTALDALVGMNWAWRELPAASAEGGA